MESDVRYSVLKEKLNSDTATNWSNLNESETKSNKQESLIDEYELPTSNKDFQIVIKPYETNDQSNVLINQPILKKHTNAEKILILIIVLLSCIIAIYTFIILNRISHKEKDSKINRLNNLTNYCMTDECILLSSSIYKSLNKDIDPCEDFYEYSCGGWLKSNLIPSGFPRWGTLSSITYKNQLVLKDQLESNSNVTEAETKARHFYRSCIDSNNIIEHLGSKPLMNILDKFIYKNTSTNKLEFNQSFEQIFTTIQMKYGINGFFELDVLDDDKNSSYSNIEISQGSLGLERELYLNKTDKNIKIMEIYKKTIVNVFDLLFKPINNSVEIMEEIIELETKIAVKMIPTEDLSKTETIYSRVSLKDLRENYTTFLKWDVFMNSILKEYNSTQLVTKNDQIVVMGLDYFKALDKIIAEYQTTQRKQKTLKIFVLFNLVKYTLPLLSADYRNLFTALSEALTGSNNVERWQTCIEHTDNINGFGYALARMFIRKTPSDTKVAAQKIIKSIKKSFIDNFPKVSWMDRETRVLAEDKVNNVDELIGYPEFITVDQMLDLRYEELNVREEDYFGNEMRLLQFALKNEISLYRAKVKRNDWEMTPSAVNAYYSPTRNQIVFPSGILQEPFFHPNYPMSLNYGSIGSVMGHELVHGFDNSGREYDKYGMMNKWWNNKTIHDFEKASECIVDQYSKYSVEDDFLNGKQTLGENIADNGGLRAAYNAYEEWIKKNGEEKPLPILKLTHRQLVFVSFAQNWCTKATPDSLRTSILSDMHSPPRLRVIGTLSNSNEFARVFKCSASSKMNPENKCQLW